MVAAVACMSGLAGLAAGRCEVDQLEAQWLSQVGAYDRSYAWQSDGHLSAAAAIARRCNMNPGSARAAVELARKLEQLPETRRAFDQGAIPGPRSGDCCRVHRETNTGVGGVRGAVRERRPLGEPQGLARV